MALNRLWLWTCPELDQWGFAIDVHGAVCESVQVGSVILTFPYTFSQMGYKYAILFQFIYGAFGCWTVFLLSWMYAELKQRNLIQGTYQKGHILQVLSHFTPPSNLLSLSVSPLSINSSIQAQNRQISCWSMSSNLLHYLFITSICATLIEAQRSCPPQTIHL